MSPNSSCSSPNDSRPLNCFYTKPGAFIFVASSIINILLVLPLYVAIVYQGVQRWVKGSASSHADVITYHMVAMEMICLFGLIIGCWSVLTNDHHLQSVGKYFHFNWYGQVLFHILTCAERHLAVVHPVTYRSLKGRRGIRIRNVLILAVWLTGCVETCFDKNATVLTVDMSIMVVSGMISLFCSVSVLRVLIRPGPGEQGGAKERVDQSKQRAFYTILSILVVSLMRFSGDVVWSSSIISGRNENCVFTTSMIFIIVPSNLVLPILFLHRAGKLKCHPTTSIEG